MAAKRKSRWRSAPAAITASVVVHLVVLYAIASVTIFRDVRRPDRLTDSPATTLVLAPTPQPLSTPEQPLTLPTPPEPPAPARPEPKVEVHKSPFDTRPDVLRPAQPREEPTPSATLLLPSPTTEEVREPEPARAPIERPAPEPEAAPIAESPTPEPVPLPASFAGVQAERAGRIVYVVDGSAATITTLPFLKRELAQSIARLDPTQSFQILVFRQPPPAQGRPRTPQIDRFSPESFEPATTSVKARVSDWLAKLRPSGASVPMEGLAASLALGPDLVFLLTTSIPRTGQSADLVPSAIATLDNLNPISSQTNQRRTVIKTIQFLHEDPTGLLQAIAREHGDGDGSYRLIGRAQVEGR